ncbi:unnamed protein product [Leuciscus chuanchicus]
MVHLLSHEDGEDNEEQVKENNKAGQENSHEDGEDSREMTEMSSEQVKRTDEEHREKVNVSRAGQENRAWKDGEPHPQNDIRGEEIDITGECRDATEERLHTIFSSSVKRWDIRWEAKLDSVKALRFQLGELLMPWKSLKSV